MSENIKILINQCLNGKPHAFSQIVKQYQEYAFSLAFRLLCEEEDAKDVVQECFIRVWKHLKTFNHKNKFSTWLYSIVTNLCYDHIRKRNRHRSMVSIQRQSHMASIEDKECDIDKNMRNDELKQIIVQLTEELTSRQKVIFTLRDLHDLNIREISEILHISSNSVKSNLYLARRNIRKKLEKSGYLK